MNALVNLFYRKYVSAVILLIISRGCVSEDMASPRKNCRERTRLIGTVQSDLYQLVDAEPGETVTMQCRYCHERDDRAPKVWFRRDLLLAQPAREVALGMRGDPARNRVRVTTDHDLVIGNVTRDDEGLYFCHGAQGEKTLNKFNFLVDIVIVNDSLTPLVGNLSQWRKYQEKRLIPLNQRLKLSSDYAEISAMRASYGLQLEVISEWEPWGPCFSCNRAQGVRARVGKCRLKPTFNKNITIKPVDAKAFLLKNVFALSCRSEILSSLFPALSNLTQQIPDFRREETCIGQCNQDLEQKENFTGKVRVIKKRYMLSKHSHLVLTCPDVSLDTEVKWRKDGVLIDAAEAYRALTEDVDEPRVAMDSFRTLYLHDVTHGEAGNYTCFRDGVMVFTAIVLVQYKSLMLNKAFLRHLQYLGYVYLLSFIVYLGGVGVLCTNRRKYKGYSSLPVSYSG